MDHFSNQILKRTQAAFIWTRILGVPFWGMIYLLSMILYKNMQITPLQVTAIITLKPMSAIVAPYWSVLIYKNSHRIISNLVWANILRYLPFLFIPWISSAWVIIAAFGLYMMFYRGVIPAWMEVVKCNLPDITRERVVAYGSMIDYCATALLPLILGIVLDSYENSWRWLFFLTASIGLISTVFLYRITPISEASRKLEVAPTIWGQFKKQMYKPWKESWSLVTQRLDFANFQIGFMLGGAGLMIIQPALPMFFVDILHLSYTKMLLALAVCKGIGFVAATPIWVKLFRKWNIYFFCGIVTALALIFPLLLLGAKFHIFLLYIAYGLYGVMQAGSEFSWHMSGPIFAKEQDSAPFSGTNVLAVGIRGCLIPPIGALLLYTFSNPTVVMFLGSLLCLLATAHLIKYSLNLKALSSPQ
jgi:hypothetical protein